MGVTIQASVKCDHCGTMKAAAHRDSRPDEKAEAMLHVSHEDGTGNDFCRKCWNDRPSNYTPLGKPIDGAKVEPLILPDIMELADRLSVCEMKLSTQGKGK